MKFLLKKFKNLNKNNKNIKTYPDRKIFVIGYSKCATVSFHNIFLENNLKSQHSAPWKTKKYDCFSDLGNTYNFMRLYVQYPNSIFILNTRPISKWIISCLNNNYEININNIDRLNYIKTVKNLKKLQDYRESKEHILKYLTSREQHYINVINFFSDKPKSLIICDISQPNWSDFICNHLNLKKNVLAHSNITTTKKKSRNTESVMDALKDYRSAEVLCQDTNYNVLAKKFINNLNQ